MHKKINFLLLEDGNVDAKLIEHQLQNLGIDFCFKHAKTKDNFLTELEALTPDIILADYYLPDFTGLEALAIVQQKSIRIPFIIISGAMEEELIAKAFQEGVTDYISKEKLFRLLPAITRALKEHDTQVQLHQFEKLGLMGQLMAGVAHEIKSPIGFVSSNFQVLSEYMTGLLKILHLVDKLKKSVIEKNLDQAGIITEELVKLETEINLDFILTDMDSLLKESRLGLESIKKIVLDLRTFSRKKEECLESLQIEEILDSMIGIVWSELKYKAEVKKDYGQVPLIKGDSQKLGQVIINLLINASQAIVKEGIITITTYAKDKRVYIAIEDTGEGIAEENLKKIFDPLFTTKPVGEGTGLGLSISYEIIKKHEGDIKVTSHLGKGTTFTIELPAIS